VLDLYTAKLEAGQALQTAEIGLAVEILTGTALSAEAKARFLEALARKGETPEEITAFAECLRAKSLVPPLDAETRSRVILDVCGTGGDRLNTINISTTVALVASAAGVTVAKHGNRAVTSQSGSADVLEELGLLVDASPAEAAASLRDHRFAFFFAPQFHPAFKHLAEARRLCAARGQKTVFNLLGPLLNPARPSAQLVGVPNPSLCEPLARVLQRLGARRGLVVSGRVEQEGPPVFLDEFSPLGENHVAEFYQDRGFSVSTLSHQLFPIPPGLPENLRGGDRRENAEWIRRILNGSETGLRRDAVLLNAAAAFLVADRTRTMSEGWDLALETIAGGKAAAKLGELRQSSRETLAARA
jgi:anthranilate phosphoribosyltransferase